MGWSSDSRRAAVLVLVSVLVVAGCGAGEPELSAGQAGPGSGTAVPLPEVGGGRPTSTSTSSSVVVSTTVGRSTVPDAVVEERIDVARDRLLISEEMRPCVSERARGRASAEPPPADERSGGDVGRPVGDDEVLAEVVEQCRRQVVMGSAFVEAFAETSPVSDEQRACLLDGFVGLSADDVDLMLASGVNPSDTRGEPVVAGLAKACGVEVAR